MNGDRIAEATILCLALTLPLSALVARRLAPGHTVRLALLWLAIILATVALVTLAQRVIGQGRGHAPEPNTPVHFT